MYNNNVCLAVVLGAWRAHSASAGGGYARVTRAACFFARPWIWNINCHTSRRLSNLRLSLKVAAVAPLLRSVQPFLCAVSPRKLRKLTRSEPRSGPLASRSRKRESQSFRGLRARLVRPLALAQSETLREASSRLGSPLLPFFRHAGSNAERQSSLTSGTRAFRGRSGRR